MEEDEGLEAAMLSISPSKLLSQSSKHTIVTLAEILKYNLLVFSLSPIFVSVYAVSGSAETEGTPRVKQSKDRFFLK